MNNLAFQIYGLKKTGIFQSTWDTTKVSALGVEQAGVAASGSGWSSTTNLNTIGSTHTPGLTSNLVTSRTATAMQTYQIVCTITGTTGTIQVQFGNNTSAAISPGTTTITLMALNTNALTIIPSSSFDGNVRLSVKDSSSATNQIKLPLPNSGTYNIWVDWGDGTYDNITSYNSIKTLHTYPAPGEYTIKITGDRFNWQFGNDKLKIKSISSWGKLKLTTYSFNGCSNVTMSGITDIPDLTGVTSLGGTFNNCTSITTIGRIGEWNMTNVTNTASMFNGATSFNQSLSNWERVGSTLSNVTDMANMFYRATVFNGNLSGWNLSKVTSFNGMFQEAPAFNNGALAGAGGTMPWTINTTTSVRMDSMFYNHYNFNQDIGSWDVSKVTNFNAFLYHDNGPQTNTFNNGGSDSIKNWNVGSCTNFVNMFVKCRFNQPVHLWDMSKAISINGMFNSCVSFNNGFASGVANQLPWNTSACTNMTGMFQSCTAFNSNLGTGTTPWNVSKVTTFASMFNGASKFRNGDDTAPINNWNIGGSVTSVNLNNMFTGASVFNRDISSWSVSKATSTSGMFAYASAFNQPIGNWERSTVGNVSTMGNITNMNNMFQYSLAFNQDINLWNVNKVTSFYGMFQGAGAFNKNIGDWDINTVAASVDMTAMFWVASSFNQDISKWNVSKVTAFVKMFAGAGAFNNGDNNQENPITLRTGINGWNINTAATSVSMSDVFNGASAFNRLIDSWNVSKVTNMSYMFEGATAFNQPLSNWERISSPDTSTLAKVTNMAYMFSSNPLNQNIGNWNISNVTNFTGFMQTRTPATFSSTNLDAIYNGWIVNGVNPNLSISFGSAKYTSAGATGRAILTNPVGYNWTIIDGGQI